jgi:hypothetical protein
MYTLLCAFEGKRLEFGRPARYSRELMPGSWLAEIFFDRLPGVLADISMVFAISGNIFGTFYPLFWHDSTVRLLFLCFNLVSETHLSRYE